MRLETDTGVLVRSPNALASRYCQWWVACAESLKERIVAIARRMFHDSTPSAGLAKRHWIVFDDFRRLGGDAAQFRASLYRTATAARVPFHGAVSSSPAADQDGLAAGDAIDFRNATAAIGDALLAGTPASYVM